ncbi:cytochrome-c peroxidase [Litoribrevibacter euphylliae]|uniref:Cytochrome-c peroxidase n=1 Tax=Litoribrevibacter euphylliae TaxID=1834034 RepID=A0ABV7HLT9_9GAMM
MKLTSVLPGLVVISLLSGCSDNDDSSNVSTFDEQLSSLIQSNALTGDPSTGRDLVSINEPIAQLGMKLFYSKSLGGDQDTACVSCHHPALGGGDDLSLPIGVGADTHQLLGPGRTHDSGDAEPTVPRNAPTTFNIALWDQVLFHDGRVESLGKTAKMNGADGVGIRTPDSLFGSADLNAGRNLTEAQARFPVTSAAEMRSDYELGGTNDELRARLQARLRDEAPSAGELSVDDDGDGQNNWVTAFEVVYAATIPEINIITFDRVTEAIAAYENSQVFVDNSWKAYVAGDKSALTDGQKRGAIAFFTSVTDGGAGCSGCHSGDFFTDEGFHNIAMPQIGEGKGNGLDGRDDFGRMRETLLLSDQYAFRTPTLLNVEHTGPYGHAGAYDSLEDVIRHHLNPTIAINDYFAVGGTCSNLSQLSGVSCEDISGDRAEENTRLALDKLETDQGSGLSLLVNAELSDQQVSDLVSFMMALSDSCLEDVSCLSQWIPESSLNVIDGNQLNGEDLNGSPLVVN